MKNHSPIPASCCLSPLFFIQYFRVSAQVIHKPTYLNQLLSEKCIYTHSTSARRKKKKRGERGDKEKKSDGKISELAFASTSLRQRKWDRAVILEVFFSLIKTHCAIDRSESLFDNFRKPKLLVRNQNWFRVGAYWKYLLVFSLKVNSWNMKIGLWGYVNFGEPRIKRMVCDGLWH